MTTILLVKEYLPSATMMKEVLQYTKGYGVLIAEDGVVGYEMALTHQPDLLLVDFGGMRRKTGYEMVRDLLESPAFRKVPIVFMYGGRAEHIPEELRRGYPWIPLPFNTRTDPAFIAHLLEQAANNPPEAQRGNLE